MVRTLLLALAFLAAPAAAGPFGNQFAAGDLSDYLTDAQRLKPEQVSLITAEGMAGKRCLRIASSAKITFKEVPVDPSVKYTLHLRARHDGSESVEENPRWDIFTASGSVPPIIPSRELQFLDARKKPLPSLTSGMPFRQWQAYRDIFYPPAGAAFMRLAIASGHPDITLFLDDIALEPTPDEGAINVNPVIGRYGRYCYSGWNTPSAGGKIIDLPDGRIVFDTRYGTAGCSFPLSQGGIYCLTAKAEPNGYNSVVILNLLDENGKKLESVDLRRYGAPQYFLLPPAARRGSFLVYSCLLEEVRLTRVGDVDRIREFQK